MVYLLFAGWTPEQVKTWICRFFGESIGEKFVEEEIDVKALLSKRLEEDSTLEKLGMTTIGKKERFSRELMAIKPIVNGRYSSLAKLFSNLLFNSTFNASIAKINYPQELLGRWGSNRQSNLNISVLLV